MPFVIRGNFSHVNCFVGLIPTKSIRYPEGTAERREEAGKSMAERDTTATSQPAGGEPPAALMRALGRLARPLVRLLIARGVTLPLLIDLLKRVYVQVAREEFQVPDRRLTDSRISLLTGVHRKDVKRLRDADSERFTPPRGASLGAQVMGLWLGAPAYQDRAGRPRPLFRTAADGTPSFEELVASISTDVRPRTVLDEWLHAGLVTLGEDRMVRLRQNAFVPDADFEQLAYFFGRNLHDHMAAAVHNLSRAGPPLLERSVHYDGLTVESAQALAELARTHATEALVAVNQEALRLSQRDDGRPDADRRVNMGLYFYDGPDERRAPDGTGGGEP